MLSAKSPYQNVLLQAAKIRLLGLKEKMKTINVLFDKGSQISFVTNSICQELEIPRKFARTLNINCFGSDSHQQTPSARSYVRAQSNRGAVSFPVFTVDKICSKFRQACSAKGDKNLENLDLTNANISGHIDMLIGCDNYWTFMTGEIRNKYDGLVAMNSMDFSLLEVFATLATYFVLHLFRSIVLMKQLFNLKLYNLHIA